MEQGVIAEGRLKFEGILISGMTRISIRWAVGTGSSTQDAEIARICMPVSPKATSRRKQSQASPADIANIGDLPRVLAALRQMVLIVGGKLYWVQEGARHFSSNCSSANTMYMCDQEDIVL